MKRPECFKYRPSTRCSCFLTWLQDDQQLWVLRVNRISMIPFHPVSSCANPPLHRVAVGCTCGLIGSQDSFTGGHNPLSDAAELLLLLGTQEGMGVSHGDSVSRWKRERGTSTLSWFLHGRKAETLGSLSKSNQPHIVHTLVLSHLCYQCKLKGEKKEIKDRGTNASPFFVQHISTLLTLPMSCCAIFRIKQEDFSSFKYGRNNETET